MIVRVSATPAEDPARWYAMPRLVGRKISLQPMVLEDAPSYLSALGADADEVFEFTGWPPRTPSDAEQHVLSALDDRAHNIRLPYAQFDVATGSFAGTTSLYDINPAVRTLAVGYTWLARPYWRTGHNTESKLLLLTHAFEVLGAVRVVELAAVRKGVGRSVQNADNQRPFAKLQPKPKGRS